MKAGRAGSARIAASIVAALLSCAAGCSHSLDSSTHGGLAVAGSTATNSPPIVVVTDPAPGAWVTGPDVTVVGRARVPGATIATVEVAGAPASLAPDGTFRGTAHLADRGVQTVSVRAVDASGAEHFTHVSYVCGPFRTGEVADAAELLLDASGLAPLDAIAADELGKVDFQSLLQGVSPLAISLVKNVVTVDLDFLQVSYGPPTAALTFGNGAIDVQAEVDQIAIDGLLHDRGGAIAFDIPVSAKAKSLRASTAASLVVPPGGGPVTCTVTAPVVVTDGLVLDTKGALTNLLAQLLAKKIQALLEGEVAKVIAKKVPAIVERGLAKLAAGETFALNGASVDLALRPLRADVTPGGCHLALAADVTPVTSSAPGEWVGRGSAPFVFAPPAPGAPARAVKLALSQDLLAKALTALWRAGALDVEIRAGAAPSVLPLDGASIAKLVPELAASVSPATPVVLRVKPLCPPELRIGAGPEPFRLVLGEVRVTLLADRGGPLEELLTVSLHAEVPVSATLTQGSLAVTPGPTRPRFLCAVVAQPVVRVDEGRLATRLTVLVDALLPKAFAPLAAIALPSVVGRQVVDGELSVPGPGFDHAVCGASLR